MLTKETDKYYNLVKPILILKNVENEGPGLIRLFFDEYDIEHEILDYYQNEKNVAVESYSAVIILGGPISANDDLSYIKKEIKFIQEIIKKNIPFLGICLGSQLLAKSGGAFVTKNGIKELGVYNVFLTSEGSECPLFKNLTNPIKAFQWHGETFTIPPMGKWLATSETCKNQAVQLGNAYGLQFHVEFTSEMVKQMIDENDDGFIEPDKSDKILHQFKKYYPEIQESGLTLIRNFLNIISYVD